MNWSSGCNRIQPCIRGTICSQYDSLLIEPHSFSQNKQGPFVASLKHAQNIYPGALLSGELNIRHVGSNSSPGRLVTHVRRWWPLTQVSSLHSIDFHSSSVQSRCSMAQARRRIRFFSDIKGFFLANLRENPAFFRALRIVSEEIFHSSFKDIFQNDIRRFLRDAHTKSIRICREKSVIIDFRPV